MSSRDRRSVSLTSKPRVENPDGRNQVPGGLRMAPELMLDLARQAAELVVERIESLPGDNAWDGEFRQG